MWCTLDIILIASHSINVVAHAFGTYEATIYDTITSAQLQLLIIIEAPFAFEGLVDFKTHNFTGNSRMDVSLNTASSQNILFLRMKATTLISTNNFNNKLDYGSLSPMWNPHLQITQQIQCHEHTICEFRTSLKRDLKAGQGQWNTPVCFYFTTFVIYLVLCILNLHDVPLTSLPERRLAHTENVQTYHRFPLPNGSECLPIPWEFLNSLSSGSISFNIRCLVFLRVFRGIYNTLPKCLHLYETRSV